MNRFNKILLLALALQLSLAGAIYLNDSTQTAEVQSQPLLAFAGDDITTITIHESGKEAITLRKEKDRWQLDAAEPLPVKPGDIDALLELLSFVHTTWPVTTSVSSHERFKVAPENNAKRVTLGTKDGDSQTLYLGTSPGFRQVHLRRDGEDNIYSVKLESYRIPGNGSDWFDHGLLALSDDIETIESGDLALQRTEEGWTFLGKEDVVKQGEADALEKTLKGLRVLGFANKSAELKAELTLSSAGNSYQYRLYNDGESHYLGRDDFKSLFKIAQSDFESLAGLTVERLAEKATESGESEVSENETRDATGPETQSVPSS